MEPIEPGEPGAAQTESETDGPEPEVDLTEPEAASPIEPEPVATMEPEIDALRPFTELLFEKVTELVSAAREEMRVSAAEAATRALERLSGHLDARARAIDGQLGAVAAEIQRIAAELNQLLRAAAEIAEFNSRELEHMRTEVRKKLDELLERTAKEVTRLVTAAENQSNQILDDARSLISLGRTHARWLAWRPWAMATSLALSIILATTLLQPGWTMTMEQRRALRVGEAVIYTYSGATESERTEMRRVMRWRTPEHPDSLEAPPIVGSR